MSPLNKLQVDFVKNDVEEFTVFVFLRPYYCLFDEGGRLSEEDFATQWGGLEGKGQRMLKTKRNRIRRELSDLTVVFC
jgi:hypothetical protein